MSYCLVDSVNAKDSGPASISVDAREIILVTEKHPKLGFASNRIRSDRDHRSAHRPIYGASRVTDSAIQVPTQVSTDVGMAFLPGTRNPRNIKRAIQQIP
eukprot:jgi/Psemu1/315040/fgenesh1_kg.1832_\